MQSPFPTPQGAAALLLSFRLQHKVTLILGSGTLAATRVFAALEADSSVILLAHGGLNAACEELQWRTRQGQIRFVDWDELPSSSNGPNKDADSLDAFLHATPGISLAAIIDTLSTSHKRSFTSAEQLYSRHEIFQSTPPICPAYATFHLPRHIGLFIMSPETRLRFRLVSQRMARVVGSLHAFVEISFPNYHEKLAQPLSKSDNCDPWRRINSLRPRKEEFSTTTQAKQNYAKKVVF